MATQVVYYCVLVLMVILGLIMSIWVIIPVDNLNKYVLYSMVFSSHSITSFSNTASISSQTYLYTPSEESTTFTLWLNRELEIRVRQFWKRIMIFDKTLTESEATALFH